MFCLLLVASALPVWAFLLAVVVLLYLQIAPLIRREKWRIKLKLFRLACRLPFDFPALLFAPSVSGGMGAKGIYQAQECHIVNLIPPVSLTSTTTSNKFNMKGWRHATIILQLGVHGASPVVTLNSSDNGSPENTTAIPFNLHKGETAYNATNGDVLSARNAVAAAGFTPAATSNVYEVIELDAETLPAGQDFVEVVLTSPTTCLASVAVVLSGGRYEHDQSETVLTF